MKRPVINLIIVEVLWILLYYFVYGILFSYTAPDLNVAWNIVI